MKMREIMLNAKIFELSSTMEEEIQNRLDASFGGKFKVVELKVLTDKNQIHIKIERECKNFSCTGSGLMNFVDATIFMNLPVCLDQIQTNPAIPFSGVMNYEMRIKDILWEYNNAVRKSSRIKWLGVESTHDYVTYIYQF